MDAIKKFFFLLLTLSVVPLHAEVVLKPSEPLITELDVKVIKQSMAKAKSASDKNLLQLSLAATYYKADEYGKAYKALNNVSIQYLEDYVDYYRGMSALNYFSDAATLKKNLNDLYRVYSHNNVLNENIEDKLPEFEAKVAKALANSKDYNSSMEYLSRAKNRGYSDLNSECGLYKQYINYDRKVAMGFLLDMYFAFGEKDFAKCLDTMKEKDKSDIQSLISGQARKLSDMKKKEKPETNDPDILGSIKRAIDAKNYGSFRSLSETYLKHSSGQRNKKFYELVQDFIDDGLLNKGYSVSYFSGMFEYYPKDRLERFANKLWQKAEWGKTEDMLKLIERRFPLYDKGILLLANLYEDMNKKSKALRYYKNLIDDYPKSDYYPKALFKYAWVEMLDKNYKACSDAFLRYLDEGGDSYDWAISSALYYRAKCLAKDSKDTEARATKDELMSRYPFSFYALLTMEELGMNTVDSLEQSIKEQTYDVEPLSAKDLVSLNTSVKLVKAGLSEWVKKELSEINMDNLSPQYIELISNLYKNANLPDLALNSANKLLTTLKGYTSRTHAETHFPKPYFDMVDKISKDTNVEPYIIFAIMKRESAFNKEAVSRSGALGLMQLMPDTATMIDSKVRPSKLKDAETNIKIASLYLQKLIQKYNGDLVYVSAAYNAGDEALDRWRKWYGSRFDDVEFIENIPYLETRMYVKSVIANYYMYNALYLKRSVKFRDVLGR